MKDCGGSWVKPRKAPVERALTVRGILDATQKRNLLERMTELMVVEIEGQGNPDFRRNVWNKIEEQEPGHCMAGGLMPTPDMIAGAFGLLGEDGRRVAKAEMKSVGPLGAIGRNFDDLERSGLLTIDGCICDIADKPSDDDRRVLLIARRNLEGITFAGLGVEVNGVVSEVARAGDGQGHRSSGHTPHVGRAFFETGDLGAVGFNIGRHQHAVISARARDRDPCVAAWNGPGRGCSRSNGSGLVRHTAAERCGNHNKNCGQESSRRRKRKQH
jgi:4-oxalocrotonate tautomerase